MGISSMSLHRFSSAYQTMPTNLTPNIIEERQLNIAQMDVFFPFDDGPNHLHGNPGL